MLKTCEVDVALLLEAAGLGSTISNPPTIYAGPFPATAPDAFIACLRSSADKPEKYLGGTARAYHTETVTVLVRGTRNPDSYVVDGARAVAALDALYDRTDVPGYVWIDHEEGEPNYQGLDEDGRPRWSFTITCEYELVHGA